MDAVSNVVMIVLALLCAYVLFVSVSYLLIRLLFPKIKVDDVPERQATMRTGSVSRLHARPAGKQQKNLAY